MLFWGKDLNSPLATAKDVMISLYLLVLAYYFAFDILFPVYLIGLQDSSKTCYDGLEAVALSQRQKGWAGVDRDEDAEVFIGSGQDGQD